MSLVDAPAGNRLRDAKAVLDAALYARLSSPPMTDLENNPVTVGAAFTNDECYPYVGIGEAESAGAAQWTSKTSAGIELVVSLDLWSRYKGTKELNFIAAQVIDRMTAEKLALGLEGFNVARHALEQDLTQRLPDGLTNRRLLRFRLQVQDLVTPQPHL